MNEWVFFKQFVFARSFACLFFSFVFGPKARVRKASKQISMYISAMFEPRAFHYNFHRNSYVNIISFHFNSFVCSERKNSNFNTISYFSHLFSLSLSSKASSHKCITGLMVNTHRTCMYLTRRMQIFFWVFILFLFCSFFFRLKKENKVQLGKRNVSLSDVVVVCSLLALRRAKERETARSIVKHCKLNHNYIYLKLFMHNTQLMKPKAQRKISTIDIIFVFAICMKSVENMCEDIGRE